jgi:hypothetical protein
MWVVSFVVVLAMPQQRWTLLWNVKAWLILYACVVLLYRGALWYFTRLTPAQLAAVYGGQASAAAILTQNTGALMTWGAWGVWSVVPFMFMSWLGQNWQAVQGSLVNPFENARDILNTLRSRGNEDKDER